MKLLLVLATALASTVWVFVMASMVLVEARRPFWGHLRHEARLQAGRLRRRCLR